MAHKIPELREDVKPWHEMDSKGVRKTHDLMMELGRLDFFPEEKHGPGLRISAETRKINRQ